MNRFNYAIIIALGVAAVPSARAAGFSDSDITFYGEVRQVGGAGTTLLQAGELEISFVNQLDADNRVSLKTQLRPTGRTGTSKPYSYSLRVPLAYLPEGFRKSTSLAISSQEGRFEIGGVTVNGEPATLPDGSLEFFELSFASRASHRRLDLIVQGDSVDSDGDGLPDWWERSHGLDPDMADSGADQDGDGWSNLEEFRRGADPNASNRDPLIVDSVIDVPESGEAGVVIDVLDSDTAAEDQIIRLTPPSSGGFELRLDREPISAAVELTLADLQAGRVTAAHSDASIDEGVIDVELDRPQQVVLRVARPSHTDGSDASLWLDAKGLIAGASIDRWNDRSGNSRHAFQPTASHQPAATANGLDFSAPSAHLFFQDSALPPGDHTVLAAFTAPDSTGAAQTLFASNRGFLEIAPGDAPISYPGAPVYQADSQALNGFEPVTGEAAHTSIFRREGSVLQQAFGLSFDGESRAPSTVEPLLPAIGARRLGVPGGGDPVSSPFSGTLHELLIFPTALAEQKLRDVHDYLESKWSGSVIWDFSTRLRPISLALSGDEKNIIRGGHGNDELVGGDGADVISGGPGDDLLSGGQGADQFMFGGVDTGIDTISDFELDVDTIDLSAHYWDMEGDAREFLSVRLETNFSTEIPTLDSVLVVQLPHGGSREIVLRNRVVGAEQLVQLVVEGRVRMGGLSIPAAVQLARLAPPAEAAIREHAGDTFQIELTRSGDANAAALEVPIGHFREALGDDLVIDGAESHGGRRSVVSFARGETSIPLTVRPLHDLRSEGRETWELGVIPHFRYAIGADSAVEQEVVDVPLVWIEVVQDRAIAASHQMAEIRIHRDGDLDEPLTASIEPSVGSPGGEIQLAPGRASAAWQISAEGIDSAQSIVVSIADSELYERANPSQAVLWLAADSESLDGIGFDDWLAANSAGELRSIAQLAPGDVPAKVHEYAIGRRQLRFKLVDGRPELSLSGRRRADISWGVQSAASLDQWLPRDDFTDLGRPELTLSGSELDPGDTREFYRLIPELATAGVASEHVADLVSGSPYAMFGAGWTAEPAVGQLRASGASRISSLMAGGQSLAFEIAVAGGEGSLVFSVDGRELARSDGQPVEVRVQLPGARSHVVSWEFFPADAKYTATIRRMIR